MTSTRLRYLSRLLALALVIVALAAFRPRAEEIEPEAPPSVSETDLQMYIAVYKAMQSDHGLGIEDAIRPHNLDLEHFRGVERHIQDEPRLVDRVRQALLDHARSLSAATPSPAAPTATPRRSGPAARKKR